MIVESLSYEHARILMIVLVIILVVILTGIIMVAPFYGGDTQSKQFVTGGSPKRTQKESGPPRIIEVHVGEKNPKHGYDAHFLTTGSAATT